MITGDQPVINVHATDLGPGEAVQDLAFYYPLSPSLAALISLDPPDDSEMTAADAAGYNLQMVSHAHEQIYAASREALESFEDCFPS